MFTKTPRSARVFGLPASGKFMFTTLIAVSMFVILGTHMLCHEEITSSVRRRMGYSKRFQKAYQEKPNGNWECPSCSSKCWILDEIAACGICRHCMYCKHCDTKLMQPCKHDKVGLNWHKDTAGEVVSNGLAYAGKYVADTVAGIGTRLGTAGKVPCTGPNGEEGCPWLKSWTVLNYLHGGAPNCDTCTQTGLMAGRAPVAQDKPAQPKKILQNTRRKSREACRSRARSISKKGRRWLSSGRSWSNRLIERMIRESERIHNA